MRKLIVILTGLLAISGLKAQDRKNEFRIFGGVTQFTMLDQQASPLVYHTDAKTLGLGYWRYSAKSRFILEATPTIGTFVPKRFGVRSYGNDFYSYSVQSAYYNLDLGMHYLRRVKKSANGHVALFAGGGLTENFRYADAIANFDWGTNLLSMQAEALGEWMVSSRHRITLRGAIPVFSAVTRPVYANFPKSTDNSNLKEFFSQGTQLASLNRLQQLELDASYQFLFTKRMSLGATYAFHWFQYSRPRLIRACSQSFTAQLGYHF